MSVCISHVPRALVVLLLVWWGAVAASSVPPRPLKYVAHPSTLALEILPRKALPPKALNKRSSPFLDSPTLHYSDTFRLTLSAFDEVFHLHLRPNDHLIHSAARINYFKNGPDGNPVLDRSVPLLRESVRAYWGEVISEYDSPARMREDAAGVLPRPSGKPGTELGWARIVVRSQGDARRGVAPIFEGAFEVNGVTHHVQTRENYLRNKLHLDPELVSGLDDPDAQLVIWRDSDLVAAADEEHEHGGVHGCSHDALDFNKDPWRNPVLRNNPAPAQPVWYDPLGMLTTVGDPWGNTTALLKRDDVAGNGGSNNFNGTIGSSTGCSKTQKIVYMGVAADCEYTSAYGSTQDATSQIITNWNTASSLYKQTFNVSLGILQVDVQEPTCPTSAPASAPWNVACGSGAVTLNDRLSLFSQWRGTKGNDGMGLWHLMSGCPTGTEVGVAWLGTLCQQSAAGNPGSVVSGTAVSTNGRTEWEIVAHEIGHNFGAIHDCQSTCTTAGTLDPICCPMTTGSCNANDAFIMSPVTSSSQKTFSACTLGNICSLMNQHTTCLQDPDPSKTTLSLNMCGNGIVENGEDCDPGQGTPSDCCNAATCKFNAGALCDPSNSPCCSNSCQFAPTTQVCRPAVDPNCDTAETCTGNSSSCPTDVFKPNGQSCGSDGLACANGVCTSQSKQCQIVGASMNLTTACSRQDNSCQVSCQDPTNPNQCIQLQSQLIDGSPCGFGGTCKTGSCQAGSALDTAKAWYKQNLQIAVPVTVVVGIVGLLLLWAAFMAIRRCCRRSKPTSMEPALVGRRGDRIPSWQPSVPPVGTRPPPEVPVSTRPVMSPPLMAYANVDPRRMSIPSVLRPGGSRINNTSRGGPPSAFSRSVYDPNPPISPRNQSWDGVYGRPPSGGSARMPGRGRHPSADTSRARAPAFPQEPTASRTTSGSQGRQRDSNWVDPSLYNGPLYR